MPEAREPQLDAASILNALPGNYLIMLPDAPRFTIVAITESLLEASYASREEIVGRGLFEVFPDNPDNLDATGVRNLSTSLQYVLEHKKPHRMPDQRYDVLNPETGIFELRVWRPLNKPVLDKDGAVQYIIQMVEDVTETVLLENEAKIAKKDSDNQRALLSSLFMQAPVAIAILQGKDHVIELANDRMLEYYGRKREQVLNKPLFEALPEVAGQGYEPLFAQVLATGQRFIARELPAELERNGKLEKAYFNAIYEPLRGPDGAIMGIVIVATEITEQVLARIKLEENEARLQEKVTERTAELEHVNAELERTNTNLEQFAYAASHDLKEPVRKIQIFTDRLKEKLKRKLEADESQLLGRMEQATERMRALIDDLLLYSQVSMGALIEDTVDLGEIMETVSEDLDLVILEKGARINFSNLPAVKGNKRQLQQLFLNLISNGLKYSRPGVAPEVQIRSRRVRGKETGAPLAAEEAEKEFHYLEIQDNGIGFEQKDADKIFNVFTRLHHGADYRGTGVGLSIVRKVAENHHGHIWAVSEPGQGSTFKLLLPAE